MMNYDWLILLKY